jgi:hypothetical protein
VLAWLKERQPRYRALRERAEADLAKARLVAPVPPVVAGEPADVPVDGEDIDPGDDLVAEPDAGAPSASPAPARAPSRASTSRGTANPRGRQQRGRKRR